MSWTIYEWGDGKQILYDQESNLVVHLVDAQPAWEYNAYYVVIAIAAAIVVVLAMTL